MVYSTTKHMDGQGRTLGGAVLADNEFMKERLVPFLRHTGPAMSPFNAWVVLKGLETLDLRVERHCRSSVTLAEFLEKSGSLPRVLYPGLASHPQRELAKRQMKAGGNIISFDVPGGKSAAFRFLNSLRLIDISNNLGDAKSLICHPATTTHQRIPEEERRRLGIGEGLLRFSVGLEDPEDLIEDLSRGIAAAQEHKNR